VAWTYADHHWREVRVPNGHGGVPRFFSPVLLLLALLVLLWFRIAQSAQWSLYPALFTGALFAWRLAWHLHLYGAMEYGGAYTPPEVLDPAQKRYRRTLLFLLPAVWIGIYFAWT
jgi:hypothetical protein